MPGRKLSLDVSQLRVDSFTPQAPEHATGTVRGNDWTLPLCDTLNDYTCRGNGTCGVYPCHPVP